MSSSSTPLQELGISIEDGFLRTSKETIRLKDIQRVQIHYSATPFGWLISPTQFTVFRIRLIVHGGFGQAVLSKHEVFSFTWFPLAWQDKRDLYGAAKTAIEADLV